jgi:uncharacterized membrane protein
VITMVLFPKNILPIGEVRKFVLIFYSVGIMGFLIPWTHDVFLAIIPYALLLSSYLLGIYHNSFSGKDVVVFSAIALLGFMVEVAGVKTGAIFGNYVYGDALGPKVFDTPLLISLNWLFLTYAAFSISQRISRKGFVQIMLTPSLMLLYDLILEQIAPLMDMWSWESSVVPFNNYAAWWVIGLLFACGIRLSGTEIKNPLAMILFISQFMFFVVLFFAFNLFR